jgi:hypothetical protein
MRASDLLNQILSVTDEAKLTPKLVLIDLVGIT